MTVHFTFVVLKLRQGILFESGVESDPLGPLALIAWALMVWVLAENLAAFQGRARSCPSFHVAVLIQQFYQGGGENIPFQPVEKATYAFQAGLMTMITSPVYIVAVSHLIGGIKETSTWTVPFTSSVFGFVCMLGLSFLRS